MIPTLTPETGLAEERREEAPREAEANSSNTAEAVVDGLDIAVDVAEAGLLEVIGNATGDCLEVTATAATMSLQVIGSLVGGLADP